MAYRDEAVRCPQCGTELVRYDQRDKWRCKTCLGAAVGFVELEREIGAHATALVDGQPAADLPAIHPCPMCGDLMTRHLVIAPRLSDPSGKLAPERIELDRCAHDQLVWFGGGELGRLRTLQIPETPETPGTV